MKRLLYLFLIPCMFLSLAISLIQPGHSSALTRNDAASKCNDAFVIDASSGPFCADGYLAGFNGSGQPANCTAHGGSNSPCEQGYKLGTAARTGGATGGSGNTKPPANVNSEIKSAAQNYCNGTQWAGDQLTNCTPGYEWGFTGGSKPSTCDAGCSDGYAKAVADSGSVPQCDGWKSSAHPVSDVKACQKGASAKSSGQSNPCGSYSDKNKEKTACNGGYSNTTAPPPTGGGTTGTDKKSLTCDGSLTGSLTWAICPIIDLMTGMINAVDGWITDQLTINTNPIFCNTAGGSGKCDTAGNQTTADDYHKAWSSFRDIALGVMAIAGLIIVIAQALGAEILDAYTIRKALPRLLIAAIGITLSWPLMLFLVNVSNALGLGIGHLIYAPFANLHNSLSLGFGGGADGGLENFFFGAAGFVVLVGAAVVLAGVILSLLGTAALAVFVAITVLILRQIVIILLILLAPIAIVMFILPNTQRAYSLWWNSFFRALLMFPLIAGMIAAGRVFSAVSLQNHTALPQIIGFMAYFAPYFMIPLTFKLSGAAMGSLGGFVNQRAQGGFNFLKQRRANQMKQIGQNIRSGQATRWLGQNKGAIRGRFDRGLQKAAHVGEAGVNPLGWRRNIREGVNLTNQKRLAGLDNEEEMALILGNDDLSQAATEAGGNTGKMLDNLMATGKYSQEEAVSMIGAYDRTRASLAKKGYSSAAIDEGIFFNGLKAKTAMTGDDYWEGFERDKDGNRVEGTGTYVGAAKALEHIERLSGGDPNKRAQLIGKAIDITQSTGRPELVAGFSESWKGAKDIAKTASGTEGQRKDTRINVAKRLARSVIYKNGAQAFVGASAHATRHLANSYEDTLTEAAQNFEAAKSGAPVNLYDTATGGEVEKTGPEAVALAERNLKQVVAQIAYLREVNGSLPPEKQGLLAELQGRSIGVPVTVGGGSQTVSAPGNVTAGGVVLPAGANIPAAPSKQINTVQDLVDAYVGDKETQQFKYDYYSRATQEQSNLSPAEKAALADAAVRRPTDPGTHVDPTIGMPGS